VHANPLTTLRHLSTLQEEDSLRIQQEVEHREAGRLKPYPRYVGYPWGHEVRLQQAGRFLIAMVLGMADTWR